MCDSEVKKIEKRKKNNASWCKFIEYYLYFFLCSTSYLGLWGLGRGCVHLYLFDQNSLRVQGSGPSLEWVVWFFLLSCFLFGSHLALHSGINFWRYSGDPMGRRGSNPRQLHTSQMPSHLTVLWAPWSELLGRHPLPSWTKGECKRGHYWLRFLILF